MRIYLRSLATLLVLLGLAVPGFAQVGTLAPVAYQTVLDANGNPVSNAKICFYVAGTTTPATTYSDVTLATPNANPLRADSSGRWTAYLAPGTSFKFVFQDATGTVGTCDGVIIKTVDNVAAVPISSPSVDVTGLAGESLAAGAVVYLSDGSGGKTTGQWYAADADFTYASSAAGTVGVPIAAIASAAQGSIRISGQITISTTLTPGSKYYVSATAGALTATQPLNGRFVGQADGVNSILLAPDPFPPAPIIQTSTLTGTQNDFALTPGANELRLTNASLLTITGFSAGYDGQRLTVRNMGASQVDLSNEAAGSAAANRLQHYATSAPTSLAAAATQAGGTAAYVYDLGVGRWRLTAHDQGAWITPTFNAAEFTGSGAMTWTLTGGDVTTCAYRLSGRTITFDFDLVTTSVGGVANIGLQIGFGTWGGFTIAKTSQFLYLKDDNAGGNLLGRLSAAATGTGLSLFNGTAAAPANWTASANLTAVYGTIVFEVQ